MEQDLASGSRSSLSIARVPVGADWKSCRCHCNHCELWRILDSGGRNVCYESGGSRRLWPYVWQLPMLGLSQELDVMGLHPAEAMDEYGRNVVRLHREATNTYGTLEKAIEAGFPFEV